MRRDFVESLKALQVGVLRSYLTTESTLRRELMAHLADLGGKSTLAELMVALDVSSESLVQVLVNLESGMIIMGSVVVDDHFLDTFRTTVACDHSSSTSTSLSSSSINSPLTVASEFGVPLDLVKMVTASRGPSFRQLLRKNKLLGYCLGLSKSAGRSTLKALCAAVHDEGIDEGEARQIISNLIDEGLLRGRLDASTGDYLPATYQESRLNAVLSSYDELGYVTWATIATTMTGSAPGNERIPQGMLSKLRPDGALRLTTCAVHPRLVAAVRGVFTNCIRRSHESKSELAPTSSSDSIYSDKECLSSTCPALDIVCVELSTTLITCGLGIPLEAADRAAIAETAGSEFWKNDSFGRPAELIALVAIEDGGDFIMTRAGLNAAKVITHEYVFADVDAAMLKWPSRKDFEDWDVFCKSVSTRGRIGVRARLSQWCSDLEDDANAKCMVALLQCLDPVGLYETYFQRAKREQGANLNIPVDDPESVFAMQWRDLLVACRGLATIEGRKWDVKPKSGPVSLSHSAPISTAFQSLHDAGLEQLCAPIVGSLIAIICAKYGMPPPAYSILTGTDDLVESLKALGIPERLRGVVLRAHVMVSPGTSGKDSNSHNQRNMFDFPSLVITDSAQQLNLVCPRLDKKQERLGATTLVHDWHKVHPWEGAGAREAMRSALVELILRWTGCYLALPRNLNLVKTTLIAKLRSSRQIKGHVGDRKLKKDWFSGPEIKLEDVADAFDRDATTGVVEHFLRTTIDGK